ncbi:hypothetical protein ACROYT_G029170 [Oculina patagonica]
MRSVRCRVGAECSANRGSSQAARLEEIQRLLICLILHEHDFVYIEIFVIYSLKMNVNTFGQLQEYEPPKWASSLKNIPRNFVKLAQRDTPIHSWHVPNLPKEFSLFIKRDDLTGCALSGNKVRKLEFVLADALNKKCDTVLTCGGLPSNHCRTTAIAARQLGLKCYLLLRSSEQARHFFNYFINKGKKKPRAKWPSLPELIPVSVALRSRGTP